MGTLIQPDGTMKRVLPKHGKEFTLPELQAFVGGYIEHVFTMDDKHMFINEAGKLKGMEPNPVATFLYKWNMHDNIVGPAVVCEEGETS